MKGKTTGIIIVVLVVVIGGYLLMRVTSEAPTPTKEEVPAKETSKTTKQDSKTTEQAPTGEVKEFTMTATKWEFTPSTITVDQGDTVKLQIKSTDVAHGFGLPEFKINERLEPGETVNVEFVASKKGTFEFACTVSCGIGHSEMAGQLIVK